MPRALLVALLATIILAGCATAGEVDEEEIQRQNERVWRQLAD